MFHILRSKANPPSLKAEIPSEIREMFDELTPHTAAKIKMLYRYGLPRFRNHIPPDEFEYILGVFAEAIIYHYRPHKVWQIIRLPDYLNYDWEYLFMKERNLVGLAATIMLLEDGNYVIGFSHADCCSHCKETIDGKLFRVVTEPTKRDKFKNSFSPSMIWDITDTELHNEVPCRCIFTRFQREYSWIDENGKEQYVVNDFDETIRQRWEQKQIQDGNLQ